MLFPVRIRCSKKLGVSFEFFGFYDPNVYSIFFYPQTNVCVSNRNLYVYIYLKYSYVIYVAFLLFFAPRIGLMLYMFLLFFPTRVDCERAFATRATSLLKQSPPLQIFEQKRDCSQSATRGTQGRDDVMTNDPFLDLPFLVVKNPYDLRS